MRNYLTLFFFALAFLSACNHERSSSGIIPKDDMINLLIAVHIADGKIINMSQAPDTLYKYGTARYAAIFKTFHTDSVQFRKSYVYYSNKPEGGLADIYDAVLKELQIKTDSINKLITKQNAARVAAKKPVSTFHPAGRQYGPGVQPAMAPAGKGKANPPALIHGRLKARIDSLNKIRLKNTHAVSR